MQPLREDVTNERHAIEAMLIAIEAEFRFNVRQSAFARHYAALVLRNAIGSRPDGLPDPEMRDMIRDSFRRVAELLKS